MHLIEVITQTDEGFLGIHKLLDLYHEVTEGERESVCVCVRVYVCARACMGEGSHKMGVEIGMTKSGCTLGL
jgi:hypothetical protein